ncbi:MAG TPA: O-antigen ligase family protein [Chloroflexia bacterium]|nr:O-antigen ligase family protein [Chloroflexia bacterium]
MNGTQLRIADTVAAQEIAGPLVGARAPRATWRLVALGVLLAAVTVEHFTVSVGGFTVKPEHLVVPGLLGLAAWRGDRAIARQALRPLAWIGLFLAVTLLASAWNAPDRLVSLRHTAMIAVVAAAAGLVYWLVDTPARLQAAVRLLIGLSVFEAGLTFAGLVAAGYAVPLGTQPGRGGIPVPYGTLWEPNVLGSYLAAGGLLALATLLGARERRYMVGGAGGLGLILAALGLSLARAAWVGFGAGLIVLVLGNWCLRDRGAPLAIGRTRNTAWAVLAGLGALAFLGGGAPVLFPATSHGLGTRVNLSAYDPQTDPSVQARVDTIRGALPGLVAHPLIGNGAGSYAAGHADDKGGAGWLGNLELHLLYDSGVLGLGAVLAGLALALGGAWRTLRRPWPGQPDARAALLGLLAAVVTLLVAYQATEGTWLAFTWVYIGLLVRAGHFAPRAIAR